MENLTLKESSLVSLGASIGSNCIPCVIYHIKQCRKRGLTDEQIKTAIDKIKSDLPEKMTLDEALKRSGMTPEQLHEEVALGLRERGLEVSLTDKEERLLARAGQSYRPYAE